MRAPGSCGKEMAGSWGYARQNKWALGVQGWLTWFQDPGLASGELENFFQGSKTQLLGK